MAVYLGYLYPDIFIEAYLVNNEEKNAEFVENIPVIYFSESSKLHTENPVYIGTKSVYHEKLIIELRRCGFITIFPVTVELDIQLRNLYLKKYFNSIGRNFIKIDDIDKWIGKNRVQCPIINYHLQRTVYVVRNICDKSLQKTYEMKPYEREIQAGAALTRRYLSEGMLTDDCGDNISFCNKQFCELTVLYWIWKNASDDVVGMVHYRRHFILPEDWFERMEIYDIDVILPVPLYVTPNLAENYKFRHDPSDWEYLMDHLEETDEAVYQSAKVFFEGNLYSPCNMFIMRKNVLNDLCEWLFPILRELVRHGGEKSDTYLNRYPGFVSERLISYFFEQNRNKYRLVYADKTFWK